jgi:hypothetical protein
VQPQASVQRRLCQSVTLKISFSAYRPLDASLILGNGSLSSDSETERHLGTIVKRSPEQLYMAVTKQCMYWIIYDRLCTKCFGTSAGESLRTDYIRDKE